MAGGATSEVSDWQTVEHPQINDWQPVGAQPILNRYSHLTEPPRDEGFFSTLGSDILSLPQNVLGAVFDPAGALSSATESRRALKPKVSEAFKRGDYGEAAGYGLASMMPFVGPAAANAAEEIGRGQTGQGLAHAAEILLPFAGKGIADMPVVKTVARGAKEGIQAEAPQIHKWGKAGSIASTVLGAQDLRGLVHEMGPGYAVGAGLRAIPAAVRGAKAALAPPPSPMFQPVPRGLPGGAGRAMAPMETGIQGGVVPYGEPSIPRPTTAPNPSSFTGVPIVRRRGRGASPAEPMPEPPRPTPGPPGAPPTETPAGSRPFTTEEERIFQHAQQQRRNKNIGMAQYFAKRGLTPDVVETMPEPIYNQHVKAAGYKPSTGRGFGRQHADAVRQVVDLMTGMPPPPAP